MRLSAFIALIIARKFLPNFNNSYILMCQLFHFAERFTSTIGQNERKGKGAFQYMLNARASRCPRVQSLIRPKAPSRKHMRDVLSCVLRSSSPPPRCRTGCSWKDFHTEHKDDLRLAGHWGGQRCLLGHSHEAKYLSCSGLDDSGYPPAWLESTWCTDLGFLHASSEASERISCRPLRLPLQRIVMRF